MPIPILLRAVRFRRRGLRRERVVAARDADHWQAESHHRCVGAAILVSARAAHVPRFRFTAYTTALHVRCRHVRQGARLAADWRAVRTAAGQGRCAAAGVRVVRLAPPARVLGAVSCVVACPSAALSSTQSVEWRPNSQRKQQPSCQHAHATAARGCEFTPAWRLQSRRSSPP